MKKFVCLLMVAMLMLALSVAVFARGEPCEYCEDGYVTYAYRTRSGSRTCGNGVLHDATLYQRKYRCDSCSKSPSGFENWETYDEDIHCDCD